LLALIDGDIVCYRCAAVTEGLDQNIARWQTDELLNRLLSDVGALKSKVIVSGDDNFRYALYPEYKANRPPEKPEHLQFIRQHLVVNWGAEITYGHEADDEMGIIATRLKDDVVICSIDKDLLQIPGIHYNFVKKEFTEVNEHEGLRSFYTSLLVGDATDNIKGCPRIGKTKAPRILEHCTDDVSFYEACLTEYLHAYKDFPEAVHSVRLNGQLLWILREAEQYWQPPELGVEVL